jgi:unsaturated rhamnogalacturonyl hydrolase
MLTSFFDSYLSTYAPYKGGAWCYEDGCIYRGLECLHRATGEERWRAHLERFITQQLLDGPSLKGYDPNDYNIDDILSGRALLYLHALTGHDKYLQAASLLVDQLNHHPRTRSHVYWHKLRYPWQVWLDGIYMAAPFQIEYGLRVQDHELVNDSLLQVAMALEMTHVSETGLYAHAVDEARRQPWAHPETGHNSAHWARALGWLSMALVDIAALVSPETFRPLEDRLCPLLEKIASLRCKDGLWMQVIDQPNLPGNYPESSASAMFVYSLIRGQQLSLFGGKTDHLLSELTASAISGDAASNWHMTKVCRVAGLGTFEGRFRDGTAGYYTSETQVNDDAKGVGPLMMACAADLMRKDTMALSMAGE